MHKTTSFFLLKTPKTPKFVPLSVAKDKKLLILFLTLALQFYDGAIAIRGLTLYGISLRLEQSYKGRLRTGVKNTDKGK